MPATLSAMKPDRDTVRDMQTALRISRQELDEIDARAKARNMSRSAYLIAAALGKLEADPDDLLARVEALESGQKRLEELAFGG